MGLATEQHLRWVRERNTAAFNGSEMATFTRLVAYGAVRVSKRPATGRDLDKLWADAEKRITAEINAAQRQKDADIQAKADVKAKKAAARRESTWW